jgi:chromosome segregation ATPase
MSVNPIALIEKAINEHGSSEILKERLALANDEFVALDRKTSELERQVGQLEAKLQREQLDRNKAQEELNRLQKEHEEEVVIHGVLEFRRGKRTIGKWKAF